MPVHMSNRPLVWIEGNIASGKSTFSKEMASRLNLRLLEEPVDVELLTLYYEDPVRWAFPFQMAMLHARYATQMLAASETMALTAYDGAIVDRSLWGDLVFARALMEDKKIHSKEWEIYMRAVKNMCMTLFPPLVLVYLDVTPATAFKRIQKRARPQEARVTLEYLQMIHAGYHRLLKEAKTHFYPWSHAVEVLQIPWDPSIVDDDAWSQVADTVKAACYARWP